MSGDRGVQNVHLLDTLVHQLPQPVWERGSAEEEEHRDDRKDEDGPVNPRIAAWDAAFEAPAAGAFLVVVVVAVTVRSHCSTCDTGLNYQN